MSLKEEFTTVVPKASPDDSILFDLKRIPEGLRVRAKSVALHGFFKSISVGEYKSDAWGLTLFKLKTIPDIRGGSLKKDGGDILLDGDIGANLSFLKATDLDKGIEFVIKGVLCPETRITSFARFARKGATDLFNNYLRDVGVTYSLKWNQSVPKSEGEGDVTD